MPATISKYGLNWAADTDPMDIERGMIVRGGGDEGLAFHYLECRKYLWPDRYRHRWTDLIYKEILANEITIFMGAASSQKTSHISEYGLIDYFCYPETTLLIVSTLNVEKLDRAIFAEIKMLWRDARQRYPDLPGHLVDYKRAITTDDISLNACDERGVRDMRKGIVGVPCYVGGKAIGLGLYAGTKQKRLRFLCDELQFMCETFTGAWPNMFSNPDVKIIGSGNPRHNPDDQLGIAAEPKDGWMSIGEPTKTTVWETRFLNAKCVNLVGPDSPNFDVPEGQPEPYPGLIGRKLRDRLAHDHGKNSAQWYTQFAGIMKLSLAHDRVITRDLCRQHKAHDPVVWRDDKLTKIYFLDPAYGGGDRCVGGILEFGYAIDGKVVIRVGKYRCIQINLNDNRSPEDQIADEVKIDLAENGIDPANCFYDSFGKGTVGFAFARKFGANSPVPVDSGARPTPRPVRQDLYVDDPTTRTKRLKRCDEHYSKFVTEMWFSVRYAIEAEQMRGLTVEMMLEGCSREYYTVSGNRIEVQPKDEMRERLGKSPDLFDGLCIGVEGARQRGFVIDKLGDTAVAAKEDSWFDKEAKEYEAAIAKSLLNHDV